MLHSKTEMSNWAKGAYGTGICNPFLKLSARRLRDNDPYSDPQSRRVVDLASGEGAVCCFAIPYSATRVSLSVLVMH